MGRGGGGDCKGRGGGGRSRGWVGFRRVYPIGSYNPRKQHRVLGANPVGTAGHFGLEHVLNKLVNKIVQPYARDHCPNI